MSPKLDPKVRKSERSSTSGKEAAELFLQDSRQTEKDICKMFEEGASIDDLERKYPLYTKIEITHMLQEQYDVSKMDFSLIHGTFLRIFQRNMGRLNKIIEDNAVSEPAIALSGIALLTKTLESATSYSKLIDTNYKRPISPEEEALNTTISLQKRIEQKLNEIAPPLQQHYLQEIKRLHDKGATREELLAFVEADFTISEESLLLEGPKQ